jgi:uncharacterized protein YuzE
MTFSYDDIADVLYVTFEEVKGKPSLIENSNGDLIRIESETGKIVGCTIFYFMKRAKAGDIEVPEIGIVPFNTIMSSLMHGKGKHGKNKH